MATQRRTAVMGSARASLSQKITSLAQVSQ